MATATGSGALLPLETINMGVGALVVLGGLLGFVRGRSVPSLVAGGAAGTLLVTAGCVGVCTSRRASSCARH
jgi:uncharacterized membrane protein (UPF0136 family)